MSRENYEKSLIQPNCSNMAKLLFGASVNQELTQSWLFDF